MQRFAGGIPTMPIHDWSRVDAGTFHDFHQAWTIEIRNGLNALPLFLEPGRHVPALLESTYQTTWAKCPDVIRELVENSDAPIR